MSGLDGAHRTRLIAQTRGNAKDRSDVLQEIRNLVEANLGAFIDQELATALVSLLGQSERSAQRWASEALQVLVPTSEPVRVALNKAIEGSNSRLRWGAAYTLGHAGESSAKVWPVLYEMLGDADGDSRWAAADLARSLARRSEAWRDQLRQATRAPQGTLRRMALYCLRDIGTEDLFELALERLADSEAPGRLAGLSALAASTISDADLASRRLVDLLENDPDAGVRRATAATIGRIGATGAREALERATRNEDSSLARVAAATLQKLAP